MLREFRPREVWEGIPVPRFEPLTALRDEAHDARHHMGERHGRRSHRGGRCGGDGAASGAGRLGAPARAQRRLDRDRAAVARRVGPADRRHRQGRRAHARGRDSAGARCGSSRCRTTAASRRARPTSCARRADGRRRQRRPREPLRPSRAGRCSNATGPPARRSSAPTRTARSRSTPTDAIALGHSSDVHWQRLDDRNAQMQPRRHEDTKNTEIHEC